MTQLGFTMHPGKVLKELYLKPLGMSAIDLAKAVKVPRSRIERLVKGVAGVTPDTAYRLAAAFRTTPELWMNMQQKYDLFTAEVEIPVIEPLVPEAA